MHDIEDNLYFSYPIPLWVWGLIAVTILLVLVCAIVIIKKLRAPKPVTPLTPFEASSQLLHATAQQSMIQPVSASAHAISTALRGYLAKSVSPEAETCTTAELQHIFQESPVLSPCAEDWMQLLQQCDDIRFGGSMVSRDELSALIQRAISYLTEVNDSFKRLQEKQGDKE